MRSASSHIKLSRLAALIIFVHLPAGSQPKNPVFLLLCSRQRTKPVLKWSSAVTGCLHLGTQASAREVHINKRIENL